MVYCGIYTEDGSKYPDLRDALEKLQLNDASLSFEPESSIALGFGFRCGFLGMLHMEIIQERLEREFDLDLVTTLPSVIYEVTKTDGTVVRVDNPHNYPDPGAIAGGPRSPMPRSPSSRPRTMWATSCPCARTAGACSRTCSIWTPTWWSCTTHMPIGEIIYDFFDALKARTKGYASLDYELDGYRAQRTGEGGPAAQRRPGGRPELHRPQGQGLCPGPTHLREAEGEHPPPAL